MEERILMEGITNQVAGLIVKNGHGVLTTERFIYSKHSIAKTIVMGALVNATKGLFEYDIPLADIATATVDRFRLGHVLTITKKDGTVIKYGIVKPKEWQAAFDKALDRGVQKPATARASSLKKQREPYSILISFLVVLLVLVGIFDLTLAFYIWLNRDKGISMNTRTFHVETFELPSGSVVLSL